MNEIFEKMTAEFNRFFQYAEDFVKKTKEKQKKEQENNNQNEKGE